MRGSPWLRIVLVCLGVILMVFPVLKLTAARPQPGAVKELPPSAGRNLTLTVTFAHPPESFALTYLERSVLSGHGPDTVFSGTWSTSLPPEGIDLLLHVQWPSGTPWTAAEIKVEAKDGVLIDKTWWGNEKLTELVTVPAP